MTTDQIQVSVTFPLVAPAGLAEFKAAVAEAIARTKDEAGTLRYDWFSSADQATWMVLETYQNSDAQLAHIAHCGDLIEKFVSLGGGLVADVFGEPTPELADAIAAFSPNYFKSFDG